jgi:co-chaperonin GroES (HSP10)
MKIRPMGDRVLIQRCEPDKVSKGGIIIPDNAKNPPQEGIVLAVGPGHRLDGGGVDFRAVVEQLLALAKPVWSGNPGDAINICCEIGETADKALVDVDAPGPRYQPLDVKVGDKVIFLKYSGDKVTGPEGEELVLMHESDVIAVYNRD